MSAFFNRVWWALLFVAFWLVLVAGFVYSPYVARLIGQDRQSLSIFVWSDLIDPKTIHEFEQQTGIQVFVNYYEGNDELLTKLRFAHGVGYDLFVPSNYIIQNLVKEGLIKKIDKERLQFWRDIDQRFIGFSYDPQSEYALPFVWDVYGMGVNSKFFADKPFEPSWRMLFEPPFYYRVGMTNEPREVVSIASLYAYQSMSMLDQRKRAELARLLIKQKKYVESYTDLNTDFLLTSGACQLVLAPSSALYRARKQSSGVGFVLPREGTVMVLENIVIAAQSVKDDLVYKFINFLYQRDSVKNTCSRYGYLPVLKRDLSELSLDYIDKSKLLGDYFKSIKLITPLLPRHDLFEFWLSLKAH